MRAGDLTTPALLADESVLDDNVATMSVARPGSTLRPHVKAFKCTALATRLALAGHHGFCCATVREMEGMAAAGLGNDLLLANEVLDTRRLGTLVNTGTARVTVAVDSPETVDAAASGGITEVLIDVDVGLPRCGCDPANAAALADRARRAGMAVRGVMGYEGHLMHDPDAGRRAERTAEAMALLAAAHHEVGGEVVSGGGTGTWDCNRLVTELQAGSYVLMDGDYARLGLPFREGLVVLTTVVSTGSGGHAVVDGGLKALAMDSGNPTVMGAGEVLVCSDEHTTVVGHTTSVGERVGLRPAHIDPTIAKHDALHLVDDVSAGGDAEVLESWPVDLRGW